jgi:hypothetical protein
MWTPALDIASQPYKITRDGAPAGSGELNATQMSFQFEVIAGTYVFSVRSKDAMGAESAWAEAALVVGGEGPAPPTGLTLNLDP